MASAYLVGADLAAYGVPNATIPQIQQASAQIDSYLGRREGLIWAPDGNGNPCYMVGTNAAVTMTLNSAISPGTNVVVNVTGPTGMLQLGDALIADVATPNITEALVIVAVIGQQVTFQTVNFAHAQGAQLQAGRTILEQRIMPQNRPLTLLSRTPVAQLISGAGRYGYMRRGEDAVGSIDTYNLLAVMSKFGGPPAWEPWTPQSNSCNALTGEVWIPAGVLLAYYTEVRTHYAAGWTYTSLPSEIKQACANIVNNIAAVTGIPGTMQKVQAGDTSMQRFANQPGVMNSLVLDDDTKTLISPYRSRVYA